jgi:hypothetical protein
MRRRTDGVASSDAAHFTIAALITATTSTVMNVVQITS